MPTDDRSAVLHRLEIARRSAACLQPWARVPIQREVLIDLIDIVQQLSREVRE